MHQSAFGGRAYSALPDPLTELGGHGRGKDWERGADGGEGGKGNGEKERGGPQCMKCVDANAFRE